MESNQTWQRGRRPLVTLLAALLALGLVAAGCGSDDGDDEAGSDDDSSLTVSEDLARGVVETYAAGVHSSYEASLASAEEMSTAIDAFLADPTDETQAAAQDAWLAARDDYGPTEAFRFYGGPIDHEDTGTEGLINAWPLDEAYIDHVEGDAEAGIVNDPETYPEIDADLLVSLNEEGGEANISTGWHAVEFLLWGQDLADDGNGDRPATDYTTADNADRRATYLEVTTDLLLTHLTELVDAWAPDEDSFRADFEAQPTEGALTDIATGIGELSRGELAGERMNVAFTEHSEEDEHSCFSDNTTADITANAIGIQRVVDGEYPGGVSGPGFADLVAGVDDGLGTALAEEAAANVELTEAIEAPFDQHLGEDVPDDDPGRQAIAASIASLEAQTDTIVAGAEAVGLTVNVS